MEDDHVMASRPPYEPIPAGPRALAELVTHLSDEEWDDFWRATARAIRLGARALTQYDLSRQRP